MGNIASLSQPLLPPFQKSCWVNDLKAIKKLIARFEKVQTTFGYAITYETFKALYKPAPSSPPIPESEYQEVWKIWDHAGKGKTDVLQIFAATILCCKATYDEKISLLFDLFDMDMNRSITRDEMTIMIRASLCGYCRFLGATPPPPTELNDIARLAFRSADRQEQKDNKIEHSELVLWSHVTPECLDIVGRFQTTDINEIRKNSGNTSNQQQQNLNVLVDEAAARERELLKSKPSLPTMKELSLYEKSTMKWREENSENQALAAAAAASVSSSAGTAASPATSNGSSTGTVVEPKWHKKLDDLFFLRQAFEKCEIVGSGAPIEGAVADLAASTLSPPRDPRQKKASVSKVFPTQPGTGYVQLVAFGTYLKGLGGKWKKLPAFRTADGPIQPGQDMTFRDVLRSYFPEYVQTKRDLDAMMAATEPGAMIKEVPKSMILKIQSIFDQQEAALIKSGAAATAGDGRVSMNTMLEILRPSKKLKEFINLQELIELHYIPSLQHQLSPHSSTATSSSPTSSTTITPYSSTDSVNAQITISAPSTAASSAPAPLSPLNGQLAKDRWVTLPELLQFLFGRSHPAQIDQILSWPVILPPLSPTQRKELEKLFSLYDIDSTGTIELNEMKQTLHKQFTEEQVAFLLQPFISSNSATASDSKSTTSSNSSSAQRIDWNTFQKVYRTIWATQSGPPNQAPGAGLLNLPVNKAPRGSFSRKEST